MNSDAMDEESREMTLEHSFITHRQSNLRYQPTARGSSDEASGGRSRTQGAVRLHQAVAPLLHSYMNLGLRPPNHATLEYHSRKRYAHYALDYHRYLAFYALSDRRTLFCTDISVLVFEDLVLVYT